MELAAIRKGAEEHIKPSPRLYENHQVIKGGLTNPVFFFYFPADSKKRNICLVSLKSDTTAIDTKFPRPELKFLKATTIWQPLSNYSLFNLDITRTLQALFIELWAKKEKK